MREKNKKVKKIIMNKILKKIIFISIYVIVLNVIQAGKTFGATDPISVINNLSTFMFGVIRMIGMMLLGWGIVQVGLALKSHDASQRANGFFSLAGGVIITFAKEILDLITGG